MAKETHRLKWVTTGAEYGLWLAMTEDGKTAGGTWEVGTWEVCHDDTDADIDWDMLLDQPDFWQGDCGTLDSIHTDPVIGEWDGESLAILQV